MAKRFLQALLTTMVACTLGAAWAKEAAPASADPALEARMMAISSELRCLVCQNQTIADSHAELAVDLRTQVREMLQAGKTNAQITDYMTARYGDFVLYRPPFKAMTAPLWIGPAAMVLMGLGALFLSLNLGGLTLGFEIGLFLGQLAMLFAQ